MGSHEMCPLLPICISVLKVEDAFLQLSSGHLSQVYFKPVISFRAKLTGVNSQGDGFLCQNGASGKVLDIAGVVISVVLSCQMGKVEVAILPHHHPFTQLDMA